MAAKFARTKRSDENSITPQTCRAHHQAHIIKVSEQKISEPNVEWREEESSHACENGKLKDYPL